MLGEKLKELRRERKLTQTQLASALNVANGTVAMWETEKREPDLKTIRRLANFFEIPMSYLLGEDEKKPTPVSEDGLDPLDKRLSELLAQATDDTKQAMIVLLEQSQRH